MRDVIKSENDAMNDNEEASLEQNFKESLETQYTSNTDDERQAVLDLAVDLEEQLQKEEGSAFCREEASEKYANYMDEVAYMRPISSMSSHSHNRTSSQDATDLAGDMHDSTVVKAVKLGKHEAVEEVKLDLSAQDDDIFVLEDTDGGDESQPAAPLPTAPPVPSPLPSPSPLSAPQPVLSPVPLLVPSPVPSPVPSEPLPVRTKETIGSTRDR